MEIGDRVVLIGSSFDSGRHGVVIAPLPVPPGSEAIIAAQPEAAATIYGMPGHLIIALDAESGQPNGAGGRGGKRVVVSPRGLRRE